jgi:serine/threonine protein kinase
MASRTACSAQGLAASIEAGPVQLGSFELIRSLGIGSYGHVFLARGSTLAYAHGHGIVHLDIKPANVLLDEAGKPHLSDFGLAKRKRGDEMLTPLGEVMGTPAYLSPEMAAGRAEQMDARSDIYSLGVVLYESICGRRPFQGKGRELLMRVIEEQPASPTLALAKVEGLAVRPP